MQINESDNDRKQLVKMLLIGGIVLFLSFVLPVILYLNGRHSNAPQDTVKNIQNVEQSSNQEQTTPSENTVVDNSSIEGNTVNNNFQKPSENPSNIQRNLDDPFYSVIVPHMAKLKNLPYNDLMPSYYPRDNYIVNASREDGTVRIFKKNPILIYIPKNEYYDAIAQAFVTYNYQFKGLLAFKATDNPDETDIKVDFTDDLSKHRDTEDIIGLGGPERFDKNGNIEYSELHILNKYKDGSKPDLSTVYNVMLHEIGHCIGIAGHSQTPGDLMYHSGQKLPAGQKLRSFSDRDIETIKLMYSGRDDIMKTLLKNAKEDKLQENILYAQKHNDSSSYMEVADSYYNMGKYDEALKAYQEAVKLNPNNPRLYNRLGSLYEKAQKYDEAILYYNYAAQKYSDSEDKANSYSRMGYVYYLKKDNENTMKYDYMALQTDPKNKNLFFNYLKDCLRAEKKDAAKDAYNSYINNYNPSDLTGEEKEILNIINKQD